MVDTGIYFFTGVTLAEVGRIVKAFEGGRILIRVEKELAFRLHH